jgi:copper(I)-binding protein
MTPKHLIPLALLAALAGQPALAEGDDHDADTAAEHANDEHGHEEEHGHDAEHGHDDEHAHEEDHAHEEETASDDAHLSTMGDVRLLHGWTRATGADTALVFVEIENTGTMPVTLTGGAAELAESAALVGFTLEDGTPVYSELPALPVAPGTEMVLAPQGVALRLDGLSRDLAEGDSFDLTLAFAEAEVELTVEVEAADATQHSHAGHAH